jgi:hypothetical protein
MFDFLLGLAVGVAVGYLAPSFVTLVKDKVVTWWKSE